MDQSLLVYQNNQLFQERARRIVRYPQSFYDATLFSFINSEQLLDVAMISDEVSYACDNVLFSANEQADACYLLMNGAVD